VWLTADGETAQLSTAATTVAELLQETEIELDVLDEVEPPLSTSLRPETTVTVVRVTESLEIIPQSVPFERQIARSDSMEPDDPPRVVQQGKTGLQEVTVRLVFHDGLEVERWPTNVTVVEPPQDEIVLIGAGPSKDSVPISGTLALISDGRALVFRGSTAAPAQLRTGPGLDGRVFALSPDGQFLLYSRTLTETAQFQNSLWVVATTADTEPRSLEVENVLWAGWNPGLPQQIAYTTAVASSQPPGWEANNDLWLGVVPPEIDRPFSPQRVIDTYPVTYGWWGGNYAWSPVGRYLAYSYANEIGIIDTAAGVATFEHHPMHRFTEYNTGSDWVWVPSLSWSPDGRYLAFSRHSGNDAGDGPRADNFDLWMMDVETEVVTALRTQTGMWSSAYWSPVGSAAERPLAFLQASDPSDSQHSSYNLWQMDQDSSNAGQVYPPEGENSFFSQDAASLAWSPDGQAMAFIFHDALYIFSPIDNRVFRVTQDESRNSHPSWTRLGTGD
jgi:hypothetical protein